MNENFSLKRIIIIFIIIIILDRLGLLDYIPDASFFRNDTASELFFK